MRELENVLYINLDHREDRKLHILSQMKKMGIENPVRFSAVKTKNGAVGCGLSHIKCLELAKERNWETVCILEDDFNCLKLDVFMNSLSNFSQNHEKDGIDWDVLLLGGNNCPPYHKMNGVDYCVQITNCQTTVGYIVKKHLYDILIENMREAVHHLIKDPANKRQFAIDMYWKKLQTSGKWYLITPLTITQHVCFSDVEENVKNYDHLMLDIDKPWLFSQQYFQQTLQKMTCIKSSI
jgi:GR25 family glycosyltransferase involved in LPS biosynthesis